MLSDDDMLKACGCSPTSPTALVVLGIGRVVERAAYENRQAEIDRLTRELAEAREQLRGWLRENGPGGWVDELRAERDALAKQGEAFRHLVDACKLLASEAEEYEFDDGMGRGALLDYWYEFDRKLDAAIDAQIEKEKANGSR